MVGGFSCFLVRKLKVMMNSVLEVLVVNEVLGCWAVLALYFSRLRQIRNDNQIAP